MPLFLVLNLCLVFMAGYYVEGGLMLLICLSLCLFIFTFYSFGAVVFHLKRVLFLALLGMTLGVVLAFVTVVLYAYAPISVCVLFGGYHWFSFFISPGGIGAMLGSMAAVVSIVMQML